MMSDQPYQVMPPLSAEEYAALRSDIADRGILVPVVRDQHGTLLDGHHRVAIAEELGIDCPTEVRKVADEAEARDVAFTLNLARRHLTREQKRQLIAAEVQARPDDSDRAIGRRLGCDHKTVGSVRREVSGEIPRPPAAMTAAERQRAEELTEVVRTGLRDVGQVIADALRAGVRPAELAQSIRRIRAEFAGQFGEDFPSVDEVMFCGYLDDLAALHVAAREWGIDVRADAWLEMWAEARPAQHQEFLALWSEAARETEAGAK